MGKNEEKKSLSTYISSPDEILKLAKPIAWGDMVKRCGLATVEELALALNTSIGALKKEFQRADLTDKLKQHIDTDVFFPGEDEF